ncbi:MAG: hypothetical protein KDH09_10205 [Chrysiogenetes bacterium]|nr:hypothetical protein [Chrysiogenetes bacterium]
MGAHECIAIAGPSGSGKSDLAYRIRGGLVLEMDDYFRDFSHADYYLDPDWDTPRAYDLDLLTAHAKALLAGEEVELVRFHFREGTRRTDRRVSLAPGQPLIVEGLYAFALALPWTLKIFIEVSFPEMVERCLPRDQAERGRADLKKLLGMYEQSWRKYESELFPQRERADVVLASDWGTRLPKELDVPALRAST